MQAWLPLLAAVVAGVFLLPASVAQNEGEMIPEETGRRSAAFAPRSLGADFDNGTIISTNRYSPSRARGSRGWKVCFGFWKIKGCIIFRRIGSKMRIEATVFGKRVFRWTFRVKKNFTIRVRKRIFPFWVRIVMRSDLYIKITRMDLSRWKACFQLKAKILRRWRVYPRYPYCVDF